MFTTSSPVNWGTAMNASTGTFNLPTVAVAWVALRKPVPYRKGKPDPTTPRSTGTPHGCAYGLAGSNSKLVVCALGATRIHKPPLRPSRSRWPNTGPAKETVARVQRKRDRNHLRVIARLPLWGSC
jgi:hypothetical protein